MNWSEEDLKRVLSANDQLGLLEDAHLEKIHVKKLSPQDDLLMQIDAAGILAPEREFRFHPTRRWRFDLCWKDQRVACEVEGGTWMSTGRYGKGHAHPVRFEADCHKYNEAAILGWTVIRVTSKMIKENEAVDHISRALGGLT